MAEIEQRLRTSADNCFKAYESWRKNEKNNEIRASLQDAVHELRKIASRIEIELAVSERNEMAQKPIPIPPHRDARGRHQSAPQDLDDDIGNAQNERPRNPGHGGGQHRGGQRSGRTLGSGQGPRRDNQGSGQPISAPPSPGNDSSADD